MPKKSFYDMFDKKAQRIAGTISAILVIGGALFGVGNWINNQVTSAISSQIQDFRQEVKTSDNRQDQAITRLELMNLIQNDPTNVAGIEKLARYYFGDLQGNQYMTGMYSNWCREYGGDPSIAVGGK